MHLLHHLGHRRRHRQLLLGSFRLRLQRHFERHQDLLVLHQLLLQAYRLQKEVLQCLFLKR